VAFCGQPFWQNKTAGTCSPSASYSQAARAIPQEYFEACCLIKLYFDRRRACLVSTPLFSVQPVAYAQQCSGLASARFWCLLTFDFDVKGRLRRNLKNR